MSVLYIQPGEGQSPAVVKGPPDFLFPPFPSLGGGGGHSLGFGYPLQNRPFELWLKTFSRLE